MSSRVRCRFSPWLENLENRTTPSSGLLDPTFGVGGKVTTRFSSSLDDQAYAMAIDGLGRIVLAGSTDNGSNKDFAIIRLTPAGALDPTFGSGGIVTLRFGTSDDVANCVAIDSQGRIVVAGSSIPASGIAPDFAVARLNPDGSLDASFDYDGKETLAFGLTYDAADGVAIDSLGRIVLVGATYNGSTYDGAVVRLTPTGALDSSFDGDGKRTVPIGASGVVIDSLNRVVIAGGVSAGVGSSPDFAVARLTESGALDATFDGDGIQTISFGAFGDSAASVTLDSQGRIVLAGYTGNQSPDSFAVVRLTTAGALDTSFDGDGKQIVSFGISALAKSVIMDSLGRIVVAGFESSNGSPNFFAVARLTAAGALDAGFNGNGKEVVNVSGLDSGNAVAIDSLGRIVVGGYAAGAFFDFAAIRLTATGALDPSFDNDGKVAIDLNAYSFADSRSVAVDSLGRILVAGTARGPGDLNRSVFAVARYTPDGLLDLSFGGTGMVRFPFGPSGDEAFSVAVDSQNRVIVAGEMRLSVADADFAVARLTSTGVLDSSFDGDGRMTINVSGGFDRAYCVATDAQDRILVSGAANGGFVVARVTTAGSLDPTFDGDGLASIPGGGVGYGMAIDSLGRIVVAGAISSGSNSIMAVTRLTASGALDTTFDGDGAETIDFGGAESIAYSVAVDAVDRIVVAGAAGGMFAVARLTTAGELDSTFDGDGQQTISFGSAGDTGFGVALDWQNRIVIAGYSNNGKNNDFAVARLTRAGALDVSFYDDGKQTIAFGGGDDLAYGVAIASGSRIVVAGSTDSDGHLFALARLTGDATTAFAQVNDGSAQRSRVKSLTVRFSEQVTFSGQAEQAFTLVRAGGGAVSFTATVSVQDGGTVVTLDHFAGPQTEFGSLADGRYTLTALASQISADGQALDGDADGFAGGDFVFNDARGLFRLFGDVNGDRIANGLDFGFFKNAFGTQTGESNYLSFFDFNGDGVINGFDLGQFRTRFGTILP